MRKLLFSAFFSIFAFLNIQAQDYPIVPSANSVKVPSVGDTIQYCPDSLYCQGMIVLSAVPDTITTGGVAFSLDYSPAALYHDSKGQPVSVMMQVLQVSIVQPRITLTLFDPTTSTKATKRPTTYSVAVGLPKRVLFQNKDITQSVFYSKEN